MKNLAAALIVVAAVLSSGGSAFAEVFNLDGREAIAGQQRALPELLSGPQLAPLFSGISDDRTAIILEKLRHQQASSVRGDNEVRLFKAIAPSVVVVATETGFGSGTVLAGGLILTNWHVVGANQTVSVIYKPADPMTQPTRADVVTASVERVNAYRDLAILRPRGIPPTARPVDIATQDVIDVGTDVHAIGHPTGEYWTYTKGVVSQFRPNYPWSADGTDHRANVIQTQTPINPGNSGGPLLSDDGKLVGVNSFKSVGSEGLNFAVAASEVREFLNAPVAAGQCDWKVVFEGRNSLDDAFIRQFSKCDSFPALVFIYPDDKSMPYRATLDSKHRNKPDGVILDQKRSGKWDFSVWDLNFDDTFISIGKHPDGNLWPTNYEPRCPGQTAAVNFECK